MATNTPVELCIDDITLCPICQDDFTDPRSLPCLHTFCLKCLKGHCCGRGPGEKVKCPLLCGKAFNIPDDGVSGFPKNVYIPALVAARKKIDITNNSQDLHEDYTTLLIRHHRLVARSLFVSESLLMDLSVVQYLKDNISDIEQQPTQQSKVNKLLAVLRNVPRQHMQTVFSEFLSALRQDGQEHVANIFHQQSDALHMSNEHYQLLVSKHKQVCQCLDPANGLVDDQTIFSDTERSSVLSKTGYNEMSREVVDILQHKPDSAFDSFISALCATKQEYVASLLGHECTEKPMTEEHRQLLMSKTEELSQFIDPTHGFLYRLAAVGVFSKRDMDSVTSKSSYTEMSVELVNILLRKSDCSFDKFIEALNSTEQQHVVYLLTGQGESPLSRVRRLVLRKAHKKLVSRLDTLHTLLLSELISSGVLTDIDRQRIGTHSVNEDRTVELIDVIARKSQRAYDKFLQALKDSGHQRVADELEGLELRGTIDPHFLSGVSTAERKRIVQVIRNNMKALVGGTGQDVMELSNLMEQNGFVVSEISEGSIHISFRYFTAESLVNLKRLYADKTLDKLFTQVFCPQFVQQLESLTLNITDDEFDKCLETFRQMEDGSKLEKLMPTSEKRKQLKQRVYTRTQRQLAETERSDRESNNSKQLVYTRTAEQINKTDHTMLNLVAVSLQTGHHRGLLHGQHITTMHSFPYELHEMLLKRSSCLFAKALLKTDTRPDIQLFNTLSSVCRYFHFILTVRRRRSVKTFTKRQLTVACYPHRLRPLLLATIADGRQPVRGLCTLNNILYVNRYRSTTINVYNTSHQPYTLLRQIQTTHSAVTSIAPCSINNCVYVAGTNTEHRFVINKMTKLTDYKLVQWLQISNVQRLSVTSDGRVILLIATDVQHSGNSETYRGVVEVYDSTGVKLTKLNLPRDIVNPRLVVQTANKSFIICHGNINTELNRVCEVNNEGFVVTSHGGKPGRGLGQLNTPAYVALDGEERVIVADTNNQRVLLLDRQLNTQRVLLSWSRVADLPWSLLYDSSERKLFVGLYTGDIEVYSL